MQTISACLERYLSLAPPESTKAKCILDVVRAECGLSLAPSAVSVRNNGIFLSCHPLERIEIQNHAPDILATLHTKHHMRFGFIR
jgi:hypothetical protein